MTSSTFEVFPAEASMLEWVETARPVAFAAMADPAQAVWWRAENTWFVGVDALANDSLGRVVGGPIPRGAAVAATKALSDAPFHRLQVSAIRPGYPGSGAQDDPAQHRFRLKRDGAHLDGLLPVGADRRRYLKEPHAFILGIALTDAAPGASPLVVWDGSEKIIRSAFEEAFVGCDPADWASIDVTKVYSDARRRVFENCIRRLVPLKRGESVLLHRMAIHGVAPWVAGADAEAEGRVIAYFRPLTEPATWLAMP